LRANEIGVDAILKATKVDGIYDSDPHKNASAKRFSQISYEQAINLRLGVMDAAAFSLCWENKIPIIVFNAFVAGNLKRIIAGDTDLGTLVCSASVQS